MRALVFTILFTMVPIPVLAETTSCKELASSISQKTQQAWLAPYSTCFCGSQLSNLTVTLPPGLRVEAVCGLHFVSYRPQNIELIDLTREKLSLDSYRRGNYPFGTIFLTGTMQSTITGTITVHEGPAGSLWFRAKPNRRGPVFWEYHLKELNLGTDDDFRKFGAPKPATLHGECQAAETTIRIRNPIVVLGNSDQKGTSADFDVIRVSEFEPCKKRVNPVENIKSGQPLDVTALIDRIVVCNYYKGEWPYADEYEKEQAAATLAKYRCSTLSKEEAQVKTKYIGDSDVMSAIDAAKALER